MLEDDFILQDNWLSTINTIIESGLNYDLIKLSRAREKDLSQPVTLVNGYVVARSYPVPIESIATLVSLSGAKKLRSGIQKILRPLDFEFKNYWEYDLDIYSVYPNLFSQVDLEEMDSYIGHRAAYRDYPFLEKVKIYLRKYAYQTLHRFYGFFNRP